MEILYKSTRDDLNRVSASYAITKGIADDGGLYVPESFPSLDISLEDLSKLDYKGVAYEIMKLFFTDFTKEELQYCIDKAYDEKFDTEEIVPMSFVDKAYYLELFHGSTIAFKDMALSILPYLMKVSAKKNDIKFKGRHGIMAASCCPVVFSFTSLSLPAAPWYGLSAFPRWPCCG